MNGTDNVVVVAVMGATGAGKSTFIQQVTGREDVSVGETLFSGRLNFQIIYREIISPTVSKTRKKFVHMISVIMGRSTPLWTPLASTTRTGRIQRRQSAS